MPQGIEQGHRARKPTQVCCRTSHAFAASVSVIASVSAAPLDALWYTATQVLLHLRAHLQTGALSSRFAAACNACRVACSSQAATQMMDRVRDQVLQFLNAPVGQYQCIFTSGTTAALQLLVDAFPWQAGSSLLYTVANHTCASLL